MSGNFYISVIKRKKGIEKNCLFLLENSLDSLFQLKKGLEKVGESLAVRMTFPVVIDQTFCSDLVQKCQEIFNSWQRKARKRQGILKCPVWGTLYIEVWEMRPALPVGRWYRKNPKISDTRKFAVITLKVEQDGFSLEWYIQKMQRELQTV